MDRNGHPFQIAIFLYPGVTALGAVGPYEAFSRMPNTEVRFVGQEVGPVMTEGGALLLAVTHTIAETPLPDLVLFPGGMTTPGEMVDDEVLAWLSRVHETTTSMTSVCTGALILGAAGILKGLPATTHWWKLGVLTMMGPNHSLETASCDRARWLHPTGRRRVLTWRFGWPVKSPGAKGSKRYNWPLNTIRIRHSTPATGAKHPTRRKHWPKKLWMNGQPTNDVLCPRLPGGVSLI